MCDEKKKENFFKNLKNNFFYIKKFPLKSRNKENVKSLRKKEQFIIKFIIQNNLQSACSHNTIR